MLTELSLENFKSWKKIDAMRLAPITGLFGTNSSGKTSILQWLLLMKQTIESSDRLQVLDFGDERSDRSYVELGTFREVIHQHANPGAMSWHLSFDLPKTLVAKDPETAGKMLFSADDVTFSCSIIEDDSGKPSVRQMAYTIDQHRFTYAAKAANGHYKLDTHGPGDFRFKRTVGRKWDLPRPIKCYGFPDQTNAYFQNAGFLPDLQLALEQQFERVYYLGPLRDYPRRQYTWGGGQQRDMGRRGEKVIDAILSSRDRGEMISRGKGKPKFTLEAYIADWLKRLGLIESFEVQAVAPGSNLFQVHVRKTAHSSPVLITDVGFGISQILPVIAICYYVPEGSTVILEQPEIHLHPSVQAGLADVFIDAIKVRKIQVIVESHSEYLLRRLQRRIAEEELDPNRAALYFCHFEGESSKLEHLQLHPFGNIINWPKDFFGDEFGELSAMTKAAMRRKGVDS